MNLQMPIKQNKSTFSKKSIGDSLHTYTSVTKKSRKSYYLYAFFLFCFSFVLKTIVIFLPYECKKQSRKLYNLKTTMSRVVLKIVSIDDRQLAFWQDGISVFFYILLFVGFDCFDAGKIIFRCSECRHIT